MLVLSLTFSGGKVLHELTLFLWIRFISRNESWRPLNTLQRIYCWLPLHCTLPPPPHVQKRNLSNFFETRIFVEQTGKFCYTIILKPFNLKFSQSHYKKKKKKLTKKPAKYKIIPTTLKMHLKLIIFAVNHTLYFNVE